MRPFILLTLLTIASSSLLVEASLKRILRQSGDVEQEATTPKSNNNGPTSSTQQPPRLYPDIPQQANFVPPFNGLGPHHYPAISHHHGQTPFVPFGMQVPSSRLNADQQPAPFGRVLPPPPKPMTPAERLQSQSFANGLGRRLLSLVGIETNSTDANRSSGENQAANNQQQVGGLDEAMKALQNSSVLQQLNKGVHSIYGGLSKMYNSTVQQQLGLLQERLKSETQNSTNPWHQRMAEQVPEFFKQMASRVGQAQSQLNQVWQDVSQAAQGNTSQVTSRIGASEQAFFGPFDQFMSSVPQNGDFINNIGRSLGFGGPPPPQAAAQQSGANNNPTNGQQQATQRDLAAQLADFWHMQVQPQIGMVRKQMVRAWRDLTSSGAFTPESIVRMRTIPSQASGQNESNSSNLIDDILKDVEMSGSEYTLVESKQGDQTSGQESEVKQPNMDTSGIKLSPQMQNRLITMQRELNQLWMGLTSSLQGAIDNVKSSVQPMVNRGEFVANSAMASSNEPVDSASNEIDGKVKDLAKLQRDADMVYETLQQQQRETAQRQSFGDRFKNFFNNMNVDLSGVNQLPNRIGQWFNDRFQAAPSNNQAPQ